MAGVIRMRPLRYTLLADGPSDRCLLRVIRWKLSSEGIPSIEYFADKASIESVRRALRPDTGSELSDRMSAALEAFPCDLLFIHRDAEGEEMERRVREIETAAASAGVTNGVPLVPVRMTEAWLAFNETAIRNAAGNPNGRVRLELPRDPESLPDPKEWLRSCLVAASEKTGRHLKKFKRDLAERVYRVAENVDDFSALRSLRAFVEFEKRTDQALAGLRRKMSE